MEGGNVCVYSLSKNKTIKQYINLVKSGGIFGCDTSMVMTIDNRSLFVHTECGKTVETNIRTSKKINSFDFKYVMLSTITPDNQYLVVVKIDGSK